MVRPLNPDETFSGVHPSDEGQPTAQQTIWHWRGLTDAEEEYVANCVALEDDARGRARIVSLEGTARRLRLKMGLLPPEGFSVPWSDGPNPYVRGGRPVVADAILDRIPREVRNWLGRRIGEATALSEDEVGKSSPPSTSPSADSSPTAESADAPTP